MTFLAILERKPLFTWQKFIASCEKLSLLGRQFELISLNILESRILLKTNCSTHVHCIWILTNLLKVSLLGRQFRMNVFFLGRNPFTIYKTHYKEQIGCFQLKVSLSPLNDDINTICKTNMYCIPIKSAPARASILEYCFGMALVYSICWR